MCDADDFTGSLVREFDSLPGFEGFKQGFYPINKDADFFPNNEKAFTFSHDYYWMYVGALVFGFITAYGIGANDVANAFATSVGAKALKVWQAVVIAAVFEFSGAISLGGGVTDTVRKGIVYQAAFDGSEDLLMIGMLCVVIVVGAWLFIATTYEMPVSTTHSCIGAIVGFALVSPNGLDAICWESLGMVVASWFLSPIVSGIIAAALFLSVRTIILRSEAPVARAFNFFPLLVAFTVAVNVFFILKKGLKGIKGVKGFSVGEQIGMSIGVGVGCGLLVLLFLVPFLKKKLVSDLEAAEEQQAAAEAQRDDVEIAKVVPATDSDVSEDASEAAPTENKSKLDKFFSQDRVHGAVETDDRVSTIHDNAEVFPEACERTFAYLQVFTAIFDSFSHGANDVANAIGPVAAVVSVYNLQSRTNDSDTSETPYSIMALGGAGIVVGLATYGYKIMSAIGVKMVKITPTRGFAIELGAAFVIVTGSYLKLPLSTTHCQVGATIGVGLCEKDYKNAVNFKLLGKIFAGWVFTVVVAGAACAMLYAFVVYAPSVNSPVSRTNCLREVGTLLSTNDFTDGSVSIPLFKPNENSTEGFVTVIAGYPFENGDTENVVLMDEDFGSLANGESLDLFVPY